MTRGVGGWGWGRWAGEGGDSAERNPSLGLTISANLSGEDKTTAAPKRSKLAPPPPRLPSSRPKSVSSCLLRCRHSSVFSRQGHSCQFFQSLQAEDRRIHFSGRERSLCLMSPSTRRPSALQWGAGCGGERPWEPRGGGWRSSCRPTSNSAPAGSSSSSSVSFSFQTLSFPFSLPPSNPRSSPLESPGPLSPAPGQEGEFISWPWRVGGRAPPGLFVGAWDKPFCVCLHVEWEALGADNGAEARAGEPRSHLHAESCYLCPLQPERNGSPGFGHSSGCVMISHTQPSRHPQLLSPIPFCPISSSWVLF